jgi:hypothetical protein
MRVCFSLAIPRVCSTNSERNREYATNRVALGQHFPRDVRAGEIAGTVITYAMMQTPEFMRDLQASKVELRQALGYPAEPDAAVAARPK